jgi:hypothetical protein
MASFIVECKLWQCDVCGTEVCIRPMMGASVIPEGWTFPERPRRQGFFRRLFNKRLDLCPNCSSDES